MKELNKTSVDVKEESNEMQVSEPSQNQIIDGLAQQVIALDREKVQLKNKVAALENKLAEAELTATKLKEAVDKKCCECTELKDTLTAYKEDNEKLVSMLEVEEVNEVERKDYLATKEEGYYMSWDKKVAGLYAHLEGEKTFYENQIKLLKHELIECPQKEDILNKKLKYNTQYLNHVKRIIKAVLK